MYEGNIKAKDDERFGTCEMQASLFLFNLIIYDAEIPMFELKKVLSCSTGISNAAFEFLL